MRFELGDEKWQRQLWSKERGSPNLESAGGGPIRKGNSRRKKAGPLNLESAGSGSNNSKAPNPESAGPSPADDEAAQWAKVRRQAEFDMQLDVYASGSTNVTRIMSRARLLDNMFMDLTCLKIDWRRMTEWDAALWVRSRINGGTKTAGSLARTALNLAERFTDEPFFSTSALVKAQAAPAHGERAESEPPKPAVPLTWQHIEALETALTTGKTSQQRILAGFFVFLVHSSHRCSNGQRTRKLRLSDDAILGESLLKGKPVWTKWAASRIGMVIDDWAGIWVDELHSCGLPGPDFLVKAPNAALDGWINRPATYDDFSRSLHVLLMVYGGESPETVIEFTPHGCRHVQVTAGTQLASQGLITERSLESLGHWEKGSKMTGKYDAAACVTELQTRKTISDALRTGWRPAADGCLPAPATPAMQHIAFPGTPIRAMAPSTPATEVMKADAAEATSSTQSTSPMTVVNIQRNRAHRVKPGSRLSLCAWWTCGSIDQPAANARFGQIGNAKRCTKCFG